MLATWSTVLGGKASSSSLARSTAAWRSRKLIVPHGLATVLPSRAYAVSAAARRSAVTSRSNAVSARLSTTRTPCQCYGPCSAVPGAAWTGHNLPTAFRTSATASTGQRQRDHRPTLREPSRRS